MKTRYLLLSVAIAAIVLAQPLGAAFVTQPLTVNAVVVARAVLTVGSAVINFADQDPDAFPSITATEGPIAVSARGKTSAGGNITLTLRASGDLVSGTDSIAINNVSWTAGGAGYSAGTMSSVADVPVGSWIGSGNYAGTMTFALVNQWSYVTGNYSASAEFTLTAP